jgi:hypothetical protein
MALQFEEEVIGEPVRSIPAMHNGYFLVFSIRQLFALQSVVLDVVDGLQVNH